MFIIENVLNGVEFKQCLNSVGLFFVMLPILYGAVIILKRWTTIKYSLSKDFDSIGKIYEILKQIYQVNLILQRSTLNLRTCLCVSFERKISIVFIGEGNTFFKVAELYKKGKTHSLFQWEYFGWNYIIEIHLLKRSITPKNYDTYFINLKFDLGNILTENLILKPD